MKKCLILVGVLALCGCAALDQAKDSAVNALFDPNPRPQIVDTNAPVLNPEVSGAVQVIGNAFGPTGSLAASALLGGLAVWGWNRRKTAAPKSPAK